MCWPHIALSSYRLPHDHTALDSERDNPPCSSTDMLMECAIAGLKAGRAFQGKQTSRRPLVAGATAYGFAPGKQYAEMAEGS